MFTWDKGVYIPVESGYYGLMNSEEEITITNMAFGGDGIGRLSDKRVIFVPFTTPGDQAIVSITEQKKNFCRGEVRQILKPGKDRINARCPHFGTCGGCRWQNIDYAAQLALKYKMLVSELGKKSKNMDFDRVTASLVPSQPFAYRTAARIQVQRGKIGFFREKTNTLVPVQECPVLSERLQGLKALQQAFETTKITGFVEVSEDADGRTGLYIYSESRVKPGMIERLKSYADVVETDNSTRINPQNFLNGNGFSYIPGEFVQKNNEINQKIKQFIENLVKTDMDRLSFVELFAGSGNFTHMLSGLFKYGVATEVSSQASASLCNNLAKTGVKVVKTNLYKNTLPVLSQIRDMLSRANTTKPDLLIADPPRAGLKNWIHEIQDIQPENILLISCYPPVFSYDVSRIMENGTYEPVSITPFDMFPQTAHFEVVGHFRRARH